MSRIHLFNPLVSTCFYEKVSLRTGSYNKATIKTLLKCKETSKLKTETLLLLKEPVIWSKIYRVVNRSVNMGTVDI